MGKKYLQTDLERAMLTVEAVPTDVRTILEVGSGDGLIIGALRKAGHSPVAFDISLNALRHRLAMEYLSWGPSIRCPVCRSPVDKKPRRNCIGWLAAGIRYSYRIIFRRRRPLWYLGIYER